MCDELFKRESCIFKGLVEGMQMSELTNEGKLLRAIIDVMDDIALAIGT